MRLGGTAQILPKRIENSSIFKLLQGINDFIEGAGMADDGIVAADLIRSAAYFLPEILYLGQIPTDLTEKSGGLGRYHCKTAQVRA